MRYLILCMLLASCGPRGDAGPPGASITGPAGRDGDSVASVKLCADDTSTYPEYALRVGNTLYAVYWGTAPYAPSVNSAFLALLSPGSYRSTGGNGCAFTVTNDGRVL